MSAPVIVGSARAFAEADTPMEAWLRDDAGPLDLGTFTELEVHISRPGARSLTLPVTLDDLGENGRASWTITASDARRSLELGGLFHLRLRGDGRTLYAADLTVVG